tara:strand:+ start:1776 stop:2051 length:276 start_codon:yes stop_codon:yes gene_type:complete
MTLECDKSCRPPQLKASNRAPLWQIDLLHAFQSETGFPRQFDGTARADIRTEPASPAGLQRGHDRQTLVIKGDDRFGAHLNAIPAAGAEIG